MRLFPPFFWVLNIINTRLLTQIYLVLGFINLKTENIIPGINILAISADLAKDYSICKRLEQKCEWDETYLKQ